MQSVDFTVNSDAQCQIPNFEHIPVYNLSGCPFICVLSFLTL